MAVSLWHVSSVELVGVALTPIVASPASLAAQAGNAQGVSLTLVVALVGIIGTLSAALVTQWFTARREDRQWSRQREQDRIRWERERAERQEQWEREDIARLHKERLVSYSTLLAEMHEYSYLAALVIPHDDRPDDIFEFDDATENAIESRRANIRSGIASVELLSNDEIRVQTWAFYALATELTVIFLEGSRKKASRAQIRAAAQKKYDEVEEWHKKLRLAVRQELGITSAQQN